MVVFNVIITRFSEKSRGTSVFDGLYDKLHNLFSTAWGVTGSIYHPVVTVVYALFRQYLRKELKYLLLAFILMAHLACIYSLVVSNESKL